MQYDEFGAMNTTVQVAAEGSPEALARGFSSVRGFVKASEERFSRFLETSELTRLNRSTGRWFDASPELFDLVSQAVALHTATEGLFDPSVLGALLQIGYDRSMDEIRGRDLPAPSEPPEAASRFWETRLDPEGRAICLPPGVQIDLGGIAKGWIAARAIEQLLQFTNACAVSAGGDMALAGCPTGESVWEISLEDPLDPDRVLAVLRIPAGGLATSTQTRRRWTQNGSPRHHIIDPRIGEPAQSPWLSLTAYAKSLIVSEVFAKALLIAGPEQAPRLASETEGLTYLAVGPDLEFVGTLENVERIHVGKPEI